MSYNNDFGEFGMSREELEEQHRIMRQIEERRTMAAGGRGGPSNSGGGDMSMNNRGGGGYARHDAENNNAYSYNNNNASSNMGGAAASTHEHSRGYDNQPVASSNRAAEPDIEGLPEPKSKKSEIPGIKSMTSNNIILPEMSTSRGKTSIAAKQGSAQNSFTGDVTEGGLVIGKENESENVAAVDQDVERIVRCLECSTVLNVLKTASLVSCPTCWSVSPAVSAA